MTRRITAALGLVGLVAVAAHHIPFSWKILLSGYAPEYAYDMGHLDRSRPFEELKRLAHVNAAAQAADKASDFSTRIRTERSNAR